MTPITIKTQKNRALLLYCFPDAPVSQDGVMLVYLGGNQADEAIPRLRKVSPYLAQLLERELPSGWASFRLPPEPKKGTRKWR
jgi:hypothetical protein